MAKKSGRDIRYIREVIDRLWPRAKKDLEKGIQDARILIDKGEQHVIAMTDRGAQNVRAIALHMKREKLCYELGKSVSKVSPKRWSETKKIVARVKEIKKIDREIKQLSGVGQGGKKRSRKKKTQKR